jgi:hypothetical protein
MSVVRKDGRGKPVQELREPQTRDCLFAALEGYVPEHALPEQAGASTNRWARPLTMLTKLLLSGCSGA